MHHEAFLQRIFGRDYRNLMDQSTAFNMVECYKSALKDDDRRREWYDDLWFVLFFFDAPVFGYENQRHGSIELARIPDRTMSTGTLDGIHGICPHTQLNGQMIAGNSSNEYHTNNAQNGSNSIPAVGQPGLLTQTGNFDSGAVPIVGNVVSGAVPIASAPQHQIPLLPNKRYSPFDFADLMTWKLAFTLPLPIASEVKETIPQASKSAPVPAEETTKGVESAAHAPSADNAEKKRLSSARVVPLSMRRRSSSSSDCETDSSDVSSVPAVCGGETRTPFTSTSSKDDPYRRPRKSDSKGKSALLDKKVIEWMTMRPCSRQDRNLAFVIAEHTSQLLRHRREVELFKEHSADWCKDSEPLPKSDGEVQGGKFGAIGEGRPGGLTE